MKNSFLSLALVSLAGLIAVAAVMILMGSGLLMNNNIMAGMNGMNMSQMNMSGMYDYSGHQNIPAAYGHMTNYTYGTMNSGTTHNTGMNIPMNNMGGAMNMPMSNMGMTPPTIIVVPVQNPHYYNGMNGNVHGMSGMNRHGMMMGM